jgi:flagellar protein FliT
MMDCLEMITLYENVAVITDQMLNAARTGDWQLLAKLESDCSSTIQVIKSNDQPRELPNEIRTKKIAIIKKILADDKEIRNITEPWMARLDGLMTAAKNSQKLMKTYQNTQLG